MALYNPPTVADGEASPCLVDNESKTIGYGNPEDIPLSFALDEKDQKLDIGYLKLFFSDKYLDLLHVKRPDLFLPKEEYEEKPRGVTFGKKKKKAPRRYMPTKLSMRSRCFGALTIPIALIE